MRVLAPILADDRANPNIINMDMISELKSDGEEGVEQSRIRADDRRAIIQRWTQDQHAEAKTFVKQLCERTWKDARTGLGADARGLTHSFIDVRHVSIIHNAQLRQQYEAAYAELSRLWSMPKVLAFSPIKTNIDVDTASTSIGNVERDPLCSVRQGEVFLFHGTTSENLKGIITRGFDLGKSKRGLYGRPGIYLTESSQKADQYTDKTIADRRTATDQYLMMVIVRVALGRTKLFEKKRPGKTYDTIVAGSDKRFREFVVTRSSHIYPQFLVIYKRT